MHAALIYRLDFKSDSGKHSQTQDHLQTSYLDLMRYTTLFLIFFVVTAISSLNCCAMHPDILHAAIGT